MRAAILATIGLGACFDLPAIDHGVCGNGIVEPGEDCDRFPDPAHAATLTCTTSCRYACIASDPHPTCPDGWGCGVDGVCRHGDGSFRIDGPLALPSTGLIAAPLEGSGRVQAIGTGGSTVGVLRGDPYGVALLHVAEPSLCTARALDGGARASLLASAGTSIVGWNTVADGGFQPLLTIERTPDDLDPTTPAPDGPEPGVRVFPLRTGQSPAHPVAFFALEASGGLLLGTLAPPLTTRLAAVTGDLSRLVAHPAIADVDGVVGDEIALAFTGGTTVWIVTMASTSCSLAAGCSSCIGTRCELDTPAVIATITIPSAIGDRLELGDVDNDGKLDVLAVLHDGNVAVARGNGGGGFAPAAIDPRFAPRGGSPLLVPPCTGATSFAAQIQNPPLLARDLDGDGTTDYVTADGVMLGRPGATYCRATFAANATAAAALDSNGDGRTDVAIVDGGVVVLESQAPDHTFDQHSFGLPGGSTPSDVDVADLDGDYLDDIVVRAVAAGGEPELWIAHGSASVANLVVTQGPDIIGAANSIAVGQFEGITGSAGGIVIYGNDALTEHDFTARLQPTAGGLGSDLVFDTIDRAFDVQLGRFVAGARDGTADLLVAHGSLVEVWPDQAEVLRDWGQSTAPVSDAFRTGLRVYGDIDGDGVDEICFVDDQPAQTVLQCADLQVSQLVARPPIVIGAFHQPHVAHIVDLDRDGRADLLLAFGDGGVVTVHDLGTAASVEIVSATPALGAVATNIDDDPELEIVAVAADGVHLFDRTPSGSVELGGLDQAVPPGVFTGAISTADLDGDGVSELVVGQSADTVFVLVPTTNTTGAR